jgi:hypothetical protein
MKKTIGDFKGKIFCLFLSLSLLVLFPANSWADAGIIDNSDYNDKSFYSSITKLEIKDSNSFSVDYKMPAISNYLK